MTATTITLYVKTLADAVGADQSEFDAELPSYIDRLTLALPDGVELEINNHDLSTASLRDDDDQQLAEQLNQRVEFLA